MEAIKCIKERRSIRRFKNEKIDRNTILEIVEAASIPEDSVRWQAYRKISEIPERLFERMNFEFDKPDRKLTESNVCQI